MSACVSVNINKNLTVHVTMIYDTDLIDHDLPNLLHQQTVNYFKTKPTIGIIGAIDGRYYMMHKMYDCMVQSVFEKYGNGVRVFGVEMTIPYDEAKISDTYALVGFTKDILVPITCTIRYQNQQLDAVKKANKIIRKHWDPRDMLSAKSGQWVKKLNQNGPLIEYILTIDDETAIQNLVDDWQAYQDKHTFKPWESIAVIYLAVFLWLINAY